MLVDNSIYKNVYKGNGVTTEFPISFPFLENSHVQVIRSIETDTAFITEEVVPTTEYSITGAGIEKGGTCIFTIAPPTGTTIAIVRNVPITQLYAYEELDSFPAESHEDALAKLTMICQMLAEQITRALIIGATDGRTPEDVLEDFFNKYNEVLELYEKILIVMGNLFTCSIVPFTTVDGQTQYSVGTELPLDPDANNLLLSLGGVLQEPDVAYKILDSSHIEFTSNPGDGLRCWGRTSVSFSNPDIRSIIENAIKRIEEAAQAQIDRIGDELKDFADGETIIIDENGKFSVPVFTPPTADAPGKEGLVPQPQATDPAAQLANILTMQGWGSFSPAFAQASPFNSKELVPSIQVVSSPADLNSIPPGTYYCSKWTNVPDGAVAGGRSWVWFSRENGGGYGYSQIYIDDVGNSWIRGSLTATFDGELPVWNIWVGIGAPRPKAAEGVGQWRTLSTSPGAIGQITVPSGGVWAYFLTGVNAITDVPDGTITGVAAGGTVLTVVSGSGAPVSNVWGFCWRIA